jgi:hypothetical protein
MAKIEVKIKVFRLLLNKENVAVKVKKLEIDSATAKVEKSICQG